jgi:GNAT superfamily N-acetyltransferase
MTIDDRRRADRRALQVSRWRGDQGIAVLSPAPERSVPSPATIAAEVEQLRTRGVRCALTGALHPGELEPFLDNGFAEHERLHLLRHDLVDIPDPPPAATTAPIRRASRRHHRAVLDIDARAFDPFWALDRGGLDDAIRATPTSRYRVAGARRQAITGYAVTGRAAERGYLQRLAVDPDHHRGGVGRALVGDALGWLRRSGARVAMVNTQERNVGALALYLACGFVAEPTGLTVLALELAPSGTP